MKVREHTIRRRVARWRAAMSRLWRTGSVRPEVTTEALIREAVAAFRARTIADRMSMPGAEYGDLCDQAHLLDLLDERDRIIAHFSRAPTASLPVVRVSTGTIDTDTDIARPFAFPAAPTIPEPFDADAVRNAAIREAAAVMGESLARSIVLRLPIDALRTNALYDVRALMRPTDRHGVTQQSLP